MKPLNRLLLSPPRAKRLSYELRRGHNSDLARRRGVIGLSLFSMASIGLVALYQSGIVRRLPDLPGRWFDADGVDAVPDAYRAGMGDAFLALGSYAATAALAAAGGSTRAVSKPWLPLALLAKVSADSVIAGQLTRYQWKHRRAFCIWCLLTTAATFLSLPLALPEAAAAWNEVRPGRASHRLRRRRERQGSTALAQRPGKRAWGLSPVPHR